jgi:hypothetical protein
MTYEEKRRMNTFLLRLKDFGKISPADFDFECGKLWGYPPCCIEHYMRLSAAGYAPGFITDLVLGRDEQGTTYVRCPKCRPLGEAFDFARMHPDFMKKVRQSIAEYFETC